MDKTTTTQVAAETFKKVYPLEFYSRFLDHDIRPDGRGLGDMRPCKVAANVVKKANGSALVTLGATSVICGVKAEFANPRLGDEKKGWIVPNVMLTPLCSSKFKPGRPSPMAQRLTSFVKDIILKSGVIAEEELCIIPGKLSWVLYVDVQCINFDGNATDACVLAVMTALKNTTLPEVVLPEDLSELEGVPPVNTDVQHALPIKRTVLSCTHVYLGDHAPASTDSDNDSTGPGKGSARSNSGGDLLLIADASLDEESLLSASITVALDSDGRVCSLCQPAPSAESPLLETAVSLSQSQVDTCLDRAEEYCASLEKLMQAALTSNSEAQ